ncbi:MAG: sulfatase-like hydrolase/transferase [Planctomycetota bacterium]
MVAPDEKLDATAAPGSEGAPSEAPPRREDGASTTDAPIGIGERALRIARRALEALRSVPDLWQPLSAERGAAWNASAIAHVFMFGVLVSVVAGWGCLGRVREGTPFAGWLGVLLAFLSNAIMLNVLFALVIALAATVAVRRWWVPLAAAPALFLLVSIFVYTDSIVFRLLGRHVDGIILKIVLDPGAGDVMTVGTWTYAHATAVYLLIATAMYAFSLVGVPYLHRRGWMLPFHRKRWLAVVFGATFAVMLIDKGVYAWADIRDRREFMQGVQLFPLYQPVTMKGFAKGRLGIDSTPRRGLSAGEGGALECPKAPLTFREGAPRPNVVILVVEGCRFDGLDPKIMPFVHGFAEENIACEKHWAGGNNSHSGIFSIMYGLYGSYREAAVAGRQEPAMVGALKGRGYDFRILSCTDLSYAEFSRSSFLGLVDRITDNWDDGGDRMQRDRMMTDEFIEYLDGDAREGSGPFFAFLWYDGSHQPYWYPPEHAVFETDVEPGDLNYTRLAGGNREDARPWLMRYYNSLHYVDSQVARAVGALEERGLLDDTLVFICGDHGEEFNEGGNLGHNARGFNRYQAQTIMVAHVPGAAPKRVTRLTSNLDIAATVLDAAGVVNPPSDYCQGVPLTSETGPEFVFVASWDVGAVVEDGRIATYGLKAYNAFGADVTDLDGRPLPEGEASGRHLGEVLRRMTEFMK